MYRRDLFITDLLPIDHWLMDKVDEQPIFFYFIIDSPDP